MYKVTFTVVEVNKSENLDRDPTNVTNRARDWY